MESRLAHLIKSIAESEIKIDLARKALSETPGFDLATVFRKLDKYNKGVLRADEIISFMRENNLYASHEEVSYIINSYDQSQTGQLGLPEFADLVNTRANPFAVDVLNYMRLDITSILIILFERELDLVRIANPIRAAIQNERGYNTLDLFRFIDRKDQNSFNYQDLEEFMQRQECSISNEEIFAVFRRLAKRNITQVTYMEFQTYLLPKVLSVGSLAEKYHRIAYSPGKVSEVTQMGSIYFNKNSVFSPPKELPKIICPEPLLQHPSYYSNQLSRIPDLYPPDQSIYGDNQGGYYPVYVYSPSANPLAPNIQKTYPPQPVYLSPQIRPNYQPNYDHPPTFRSNYSSNNVMGNFRINKDDEEGFYQSARKTGLKYRKSVNTAHLDSVDETKIRPQLLKSYDDLSLKYMNKSQMSGKDWKSVDNKSDFRSTTATMLSKTAGLSRTFFASSQYGEGLLSSTKFHSGRTAEPQHFNIDDIKLKYQNLKYSIDSYRGVSNNKY